MKVLVVLVICTLHKSSAGYNQPPHQVKDSNNFYYPSDHVIHVSSEPAASHVPQSHGVFHEEHHELPVAPHVPQPSVHVAEFHEEHHDLPPPLISHHEEPIHHAEQKFTCYAQQTPLDDLPPGHSAEFHAHHDFPPFNNYHHHHESSIRGHKELFDHAGQKFICYAQSTPIYQVSFIIYSIKIYN